MLRIGEWERGFVFWPSQHTNLRVYLWFYEWNLFDAICEGIHTRGYWIPIKRLSKDRRRGVLIHPGMELLVTATDDKIDLQLKIVNETDHYWPETAAIVPCFNPGAPDREQLFLSAPTWQFFDDDRQRTWFVSSRGLAHLRNRDIHFNEQLYSSFSDRGKPREFVFSDKWPTSTVNATEGIIIRESVNRLWVTGVAWEEFVSVQAHNPWRCMHLSIKVGPLEPRQTRTLRGKLYLFKGTKEMCFEKFLEDTL